MSNSQLPSDSWVACTDRLPENGVTVLAFFKNELGKRRRVLAYYTRQWATVAEGFDDDAPDDWYDVDESGTSHIPEGWYEVCYSQNVDQYMHEEITHWQPLPEGPR